MELDDFKRTWQEMDRQFKDHTTLNLKTFDKMDKAKINASLKKVIVPEILGSIACIGCAVYLVISFNKLNTVLFQVTGVICILLFVVLAFISTLSIYQLAQAGDLNKSYADTLKEFASQKIRFCRLQKLNLTLSHLLLLTVILLSTKLFGENKHLANPYFWTLSISIGYIFLVFFSKWVFRSYNRTIRQTEHLLHQLM